MRTLEIVRTVLIIGAVHLGLRPRRVTGGRADGLIYWSAA
jgi:hypothetical protein